MKLIVLVLIVFAGLLLFGCIVEPVPEEVPPEEEPPEELGEQPPPDETPSGEALPAEPHPDEVPPKEPEQPEELCITNEEYAQPEQNAPVLSLPFDVEDYYPAHWGMVPFCAELKSTGQIHGAIDFELKPDAKIYAAEDGIVERTQIGQEEGSGEIIMIEGDGFSLDYSGLTNLQVQAGDEIKKGDYIANAVRIPHGEYHLHMGMSIDGIQECPLKYMDQEFRDASEQMFAQAHYQSQTTAPCLCNCEYVTPLWG